MASQLLNHLTGGVLKYCHFCMVGRNLDSCAICSRRTQQQTLQQIMEIRRQPTEVAKALLHTLYGLNEDDNDLLDALCDLFQSAQLEAWAQMAIFVMGPYLNEGQLKVLLSFTKVFHIAYCEYFSLHASEAKIHLILHLTECMEQFGPSSAFNAERFESLNSRVRTFNVFSNRLAPSRDIVCHFSVLQHLRFYCHDGQMMAEERCSLDLKELLSSDVIQHVVCGIPYKELRKSRAIYQPGSARKVAHSSAMLSTLPLHAVGYQQPISIEALQQSDSSYTIFMDNLVMNQLVTPCAAIVSLDSSLVNVEDYIEMSSVHDQYCPFFALKNAISATIDIGGSHRVVVTDPLQSSVLDHTDVILRAPAFHPYGSQQYPSRAAPKLVYSGAPTAAGSSQGVLSAAGWHQILGSVCQCSYPQQMYDISHDARGKENLISRAGGFKGVKNSPSIMKATSSSFNVLAELEAIRHKRDEAAQQNEAPVAGSVEGQSVPACKNRDTGTDWPSTDPATGVSFCCAASSLFGLSCFGILTQLSDANQLLTKLFVKSLQLLVLHTQAWEQLLTESPSAGTIDSEQWQTQSILMTPLQDSQQLKLAKWKFQLLGILQWGH
ncbi:hypothetical protein EMCRGX_G022899 [Ephydatia muelleri]